MINNIVLTTLFYFANKSLRNVEYLSRKKLWSVPWWTSHGSVRRGGHIPDVRHLCPRLSRSLRHRSEVLDTGWRNLRGRRCGRHERSVQLGIPQDIKNAEYLLTVTNVVTIKHLIVVLNI